MPAPRQMRLAVLAGVGLALVALTAARVAPWLATHASPVVAYAGSLALAAAGLFLVALCLIGGGRQSRLHAFDCPTCCGWGP